MAGSSIWAPVGDKGPDGDPGPQGPPGEQGPPGIPGATEDLRFLGNKTSPPATRNNGTALIAGDRYTATNEANKEYIWSGSAWVPMIYYRNRDLFSRLTDCISVHDFGAVGDGITNDTAAIQAAINSGFKRLIAQPGKVFRITDSLVVNADSIALDFFMSEIRLDDATGLKSHINAGDGVVQKNGLRFEHVTFTRVQAATAGYAINGNSVGVMLVDGCNIYGDNKIFNGINLFKAIICTVQFTTISNCKNFSTSLQGTGLGANRNVDTVLRGNRFEGGVTSVSSFDFVEGLFARDNIFFNTSGSAVAVNASTNANGLVSFKFQHNDFDTCGGDGIYINAVNNVQITGCWASNIVGNAVRLGPTSDGVLVSDNQLYSMGAGVYVEGNSASVNNNLISGGTNCVTVAPSASNTGIKNNSLSNAQYGVYAAGAGNNLHIAGNTIVNMSTGTILITSTAGIKIFNNTGDSAVGVASFITVGASPFVYTAGARPESIAISAGVVSEVKIGVTAVAFTTNRDLMLSPGQTMTVTYSGIPFITKNIVG